MLYNHVDLNVCTLPYVNITLGFTYAFSCVSEMQTQSDALYKSYILSLQRQQNSGALRREWNGWQEWAKKNKCWVAENRRWLITAKHVLAASSCNYCKREIWEQIISLSAALKAARLFWFVYYRTYVLKATPCIKQAFLLACLWHDPESLVESGYILCYMWFCLLLCWWVVCGYQHSCHLTNLIQLSNQWHLLAFVNL